MKATLRLLLCFFVFVIVAVPPAQAQSARHVTTTLLPVQARSPQAGTAGLLWLRQGTESRVDPAKDLFLQFDLSKLPRGLAERDFIGATLRLVAQNVVYQPAGDPDTGGTLVSVKGQVAAHDFSGVQSTESVVALSTLTPARAIAAQASEELRKAVYRAYASPDRQISLRLFSESHKASTLFYSPTGFGDTHSNLPRLVIEYDPGAPDLRETLSWLQHQRDPEHTGRSAWAPFQNPTGYSLVQIRMPPIEGQRGGIADYPLIYNGRIYLVYKVRDINYLMALDFKGEKLWRQDIGKGTVQRSPVISREGTLYAVTENRIAAYDLNDAGRLTSSYQLRGKLSDYTDLTVGHDGSLFLALTQDELNFVYGFTRDLKPFLKAGPFAAGPSKVSTVTVSANGRQISAQTADGAVVVDVAEPAHMQKSALAFGKESAWEYYHVPVAGPQGEVTIYSDFTSRANRGNVWGLKGGNRVWSRAGTLTAQPVLGSNGIVYFVQDGALQGHPYDQLGSPSIAKGDGLNATSNLVMDGANNVYFWDNGKLHGYSPQAERLFEQDFTSASGLERLRPADPQTLAATRASERSDVAAGPEQFIRLMLGADGTLWANNRNADALFAFTPSYAASDPFIRQTLQTHTVYRATGVLTLGSEARVATGTQVLLQARKGISFSAGFTVDKGASVLARTGF
jgi:hypothetical protein